MFTVVAFHAHPDDEALLTGGTLALLAAEGHRVVLVTATDGDRGLAGSDDGIGESLATLRRSELHRAAAALHCARVVTLGFSDSGLHPDPADPSDADVFAHLDVLGCAQVLAVILIEEDADVLMIYDRHGGYGHPDHLQVHRVGVRAAALAATPVVLEATAPGRLFRWVLRVLGWCGHALGGTAPLGTRDVFADPGTITHRVDVRTALEAKRAAMGAHASQRRAQGGSRVLDRMLALPGPVFALAFGHEWFIEHGRGDGPQQHDPLVTLRRTVGPVPRR